MQVLGGNGFMEDSGMPKLARDTQMLAALRPSASRPDPQLAALLEQTEGNG